MRWTNSELPAYAGTNRPAHTEVFDLVDRDGNVVKRFSKAADGTLTEQTQQFTPPVAAVIVATIDTALSGEPALLTFGDLLITTVAEGEGIPDDDDGTELFPYLEANKHLIPAQSVVDNEDGTATITMLPGAYVPAFVSADAALTFETTTAGADEVRELAENPHSYISQNAEVVTLALPTEDPEVAGQLWSDEGIVTVSGGPVE